MSGVEQYNCPMPTGPWIDPQTGQMSYAWRQFLMVMYARTGQPGAAAVGVPTSNVEGIATGAQGAAAAAQISAANAQTTADNAALAVVAEAGVRATADTVNANAIAAETSRATLAESLLAPLTDPVGIGTATWPKFALSAGPTWSAGAGPPGALVEPLGSFYVDTGGALGATIFVSRGGGVWNSLAGV